MQPECGERLRFLLAEHGFTLGSCLVMAMSSGLDNEKLALLSHTLLEESKLSINRKLADANIAQMAPLANVITLPEDMDDAQLCAEGASILSQFVNLINDPAKKDAMIKAVELLDKAYE